jgi:hypothetical protein
VFAGSVPMGEDGRSVVTDSEIVYCKAFLKYTKIMWPRRKMNLFRKLNFTNVVQQP